MEGVVNSSLIRGGWVYKRKDLQVHPKLTVLSSTTVTHARRRFDKKKNSICRVYVFQPVYPSLIVWLQLYHMFLLSYLPNFS